MAQDNQMPAMDLDSILESELGTQNTEAETNSEVPATETEEPPTPPAPGGTGEENGVTPAEETPAGTETSEASQQSGSNKRQFSRLEKAEYSATKWKRKAKKLAEERDKVAAEFNRYKSLNPAVFRNPEERMQFLAWKASTAQRLKDMDEDLNQVAASEAEDAYEEKIAQNYSSPENAESFRQMDDHYSGALEYMCGQVDPDGIILDYLKDSPYEPAMRNVIYKNGELQEELFRVYRNPAIGNARRQQILQRLEARVAAYFNRGKEKPAAPAKPAAKNPEVPPQQTAAPAERKPKFKLPERKATAPAPKPQVTGSLTRGNAGASEPDNSAQADQLFTQLFGAGR